MRIVVNTSNIIVMMSEDGDPTPGPGETSILLNEQQKSDLLALTQSPNGGFTFINGVIAALPPIRRPSIKAMPDANARAGMLREASELADSLNIQDQIQSLKLRLELLGG